MNIWPARIDYVMTDVQLCWPIQFHPVQCTKKNATHSIWHLQLNRFVLAWATNMLFYLCKSETPDVRSQHGHIAVQSITQLNLRFARQTGLSPAHTKNQITPDVSGTIFYLHLIIPGNASSPLAYWSMLIKRNWFELWLELITLHDIIAPIVPDSEQLFEVNGISAANTRRCLPDALLLPKQQQQYPMQGNKVINIMAGLFQFQSLQF